MAVPDNFTFTLQNVVTEIGCASNMQACVDNAISSCYDSTYSGEVGLKKFRNYAHFTAVPSSLTFDYLGNAISGYSITITSTIDWYCTCNTSEIGGLATYPTSGSGSGSVDVIISSTNYEVYELIGTVDFYRTSDNAYLTSVFIIQRNQ